MSFQTAPVGLVMTAIVAGRGRQRPLARRVEQPFGRESRLQRLEAQGQVAETRRLDRFDVQLQRALRLEQVDPAVGDDPEPGLGLERRPHPLVTEPDALELVALVLEREVGVAADDTVTRPISPSTHRSASRGSVRTAPRIAELSNSLRIASLVDVSSWKPVVGSSAGSARSSVVIGSFRFRSMRA